MASGKTVADAEARWLVQWKKAATELDDQRAAELRALTPTDAWAAIEAVLTFPVSTPLPKERRSHSGLVELQEHLKQLRSQ